MSPRWCNTPRVAVVDDALGTRYGCLLYRQVELTVALSQKEEALAAIEAQGLEVCVDVFVQTCVQYRA